MISKFWLELIYYLVAFFTIKFDIYAEKTYRIIDILNIIIWAHSNLMYVFVKNSLSKAVYFYEHLRVSMHKYLWDLLELYPVNRVICVAVNILLCKLYQRCHSGLHSSISKAAVWLLKAIYYTSQKAHKLCVRRFAHTNTSYTLV